ncbi:neuropeptide Y receptor type 2 [Coregonus clupeaformis]|uniref:neuropeptide Y receptor type 2 n=1 Tax=Coregonus clupeaformis TaxID=59861 RepID=UPI001BDFE269|nr:neuropeptide Y receptor type 2 [Coregonus clupeaformis]
MNLTQDQLSDQLSFTPLLHVGKARQNSSYSFYDSFLLPSSSSSLLSSDSLLHPSSHLPSSLFPPDPSLLPSSLLPPDDSELTSLLWTVHEPTTVALTLMYCLSFLVGFVGNIMSIKVLINRRSERLAAVSATRYLLVNLAVCDLAVVCVCMPITLGHQIYSAWVYGDFLCRAVPFTQAVSVSASVLTLTVISVNRYFSVRCPLRARSLFTRRRILATVAVVWVVSSAICAPLVFMNRRDEISLGVSFVIPVCQEVWPGPRLKQGYTVLLFVALYCIPVTFNLTIGFLTGRRLWGDGKRTFTELDSRSRALHTERLKTRKKIAKMVVALVLLFAVSWLPLYLAEFWIDRVQHPPSWLMQTQPFAQWLGLTNSSLNPICYCFIGDLHRGAKVFRTHYHRRIAALFGSSFANAATTTAAEGGVAAATVAASTAAIPKLFTFSRGQGAGKMEDGSENSLSDWYKSSASVCESSLPPSHPDTPHTHSLRTVCVDRMDTSPLNRDCGGRKDTLPLRRHSENERRDTLPLRPLVSADRRDTLHLRLAFEDRLDTQIGHLPLRRVLDIFPLRTDSVDSRVDTSPLRPDCGGEKTYNLPLRVDTSPLRRDSGDVISEHITSL